MSGYMYPFPKGTRKSQAFGVNPGGYNPAGGHTGDDWAVPVGTPVRAAGDGVIELSSWVGANALSNPWWLTQMGGDNLVLNCGNEYPTFIYCHLSDSTAPVGKRVRKGEVIGFSGNSGTATTGPHCHVEVLPPRWNFHNGTYGRVNPELYFNEYWADSSVQGTDGNMAPHEITAQQAEAIAQRAAALVLHTDLPWYGRDGIIPAEGRRTTTLALQTGWIDTQVATTYARINESFAKIAELSELVKQLAVKQGVVIDYAAIAKAVNDDAAKRLAK